MIFKDWFFQQFPDYIQDSDVNQNALGEGTWQRYLRGYGMELDESFMPYFDNFLDIVDVVKTDDKYLPLVSFILGSPPSPDTNATYRKILGYIISIYKIKGTKRAYQIFMNLLGVEIDIIEDMPNQKISYDMDGVIYDMLPTVYKYDSFCDNCSGYYITYTSTNDTTNPFIYNAVPADTLAKIISVLCFLQPINATFKGLIRAVRLKEGVDTNLTEIVANNNNLVFASEGGVIFVNEDGVTQFKPE
jgi:hypothetical protein